jgi:hypothetical protein
MDFATSKEKEQERSLHQSMGNSGRPRDAAHYDGVATSFISQQHF